MAKILLVEDNDWNSDMLSRRLVRRGHEVVIVIDGEEAIHQTLEISPEIILMDLSLPGEIDGIEATIQLKEESKTAEIPVIALTANATEEIKKKALEAGCEEFLTKPVDFDELIATIKKYTSLPAEEDEEE